MKTKIILTLLLGSFFCMSTRAQQKATISGYVQDATSSETLLGATIQNKNTRAATTTNSYGFYTITLPQGKVSLSCSYIGYTAHSQELELTKDTIINIRLQQSAELPEVIVASAHENGGIQATGMGVTDISVSQIAHTPALLGETDVVRTIQLLPGVQSGMDGTAGLYVRGGNGDENLIMLDGTPIYKVDHLFGFFSVFTPEALKKVTFYKSSYPARYNGRLSSIVDIRTKDGDMHHFHGTASLGLLTSRVQLEGPITKGRTSFNFSARTTYIGWLIRPFLSEDNKFNYQFYDLNLKLNHRFSDRDRLFFTLYKGRDVLGDQFKDNWGSSTSRNISNYGSDIAWGNAIASMRWNHIFSNQLFANVTAAYNHYDMHIDSYDHSTYSDRVEKEDATYKSQITDWSGTIDFDYDPTPQHRIKFGASYTYHKFQPETSGNSTIFQKDGEQPVVEHYISPSRPIYSHEALIYAEDDWKIAPRFTANFGGSISLFHVRSKSYFTVQPRLSLKYDATSDVYLKASYSEMSQSIHLLTSMPISMPTDLWVPITNDIKPEHSRQYSLGAYYTGWQGWELSLESYYKHLDNVLEYKDGMGFAGSSSNWEMLVSMGKGRSYGVEAMLRRTVGNLKGWLSYTLSKSDRMFSKESGVNDGKEFPFTYDRRHNINIVLNWSPTKRFDLDATWMFHSGAAATVPLERAQVLLPNSGPTIENYVSNRNNYRLPASHTLSVGANFRKMLKGNVERVWNISLYNAYNAMNPTLIFIKDDTDVAATRRKLTKFTLLPCIPSFTLTYKF